MVVVHALLIEDSDLVASTITKAFPQINFTRVTSAINAAAELGFEFKVVDDAYEISATEQPHNFDLILADNELVGDITGLNLFKYLAQGYELADDDGLYKNNFLKIPTIIKITSTQMLMSVEKIGYYAVMPNIEGQKNSPSWVESIRKAIEAALAERPQRNIAKKNG